MALKLKLALWCVTATVVLLSGGSGPLAVLPMVQAHANMVWPPSWMDAGGRIGMASGMECAAGCADAVLGVGGCACYWFTNNTHLPSPPTIPDKSSMRTYFNVDAFDWTASNPWRAPGLAHVHSACGVAGGNPLGCPAGDPQGRNCPGGGYGFGPDAILHNFTNVVTTTWTAGSIVEAAWGIKANHGGGYSYRLCARSDPNGLTEECFQRGTMRFHGDTQWAQFGNDKSTRIAFPAARLDVGTYPPGSQWTRNPVPACKGYDGGFTSDHPNKCPTGTQFPPPAPGIQGFGVNDHPADSHDLSLKFNIVDELEVPDLPPGDYVLSFRWDCEQTPQIWTTCADIKIVAQ